ncbi:MAG: hypothetical protein CVT75_03180 [Alphaproteobacteria bacterium HGW-Alphaproteobacteria-14]|nr:MAG: hypothetical protein CVT75_03180 [Alphaproteobacteria bacterium HGW-Alphaproteobacteria-14]
MTTGQQDQPTQRRRRKLSSHPAFAPMLGVWGAALAGLSVMVMPPALIAQLSKGSVLMPLGDRAQIVLAIGGALLLGGALLVIASRASRAERGGTDAPSLVARAANHVRAIDPKHELGSASLDEPLEAIPFAAPVPAHPPGADTPMLALPPPRALDLAEFAQLPGRNAVWVEEAPEPIADDATTLEPHVDAEPVRLAPKPEAATPPAPAANPGTAALTRLRAMPVQELSVIQMVERFAGALHEHRTTAPGTAGSRHDIVAREAALAEAMKALAALSGERGAAIEGEPLRDALARLQGLRGAA